jgi:hypothetical protein
LCPEDKPEAELEDCEVFWPADPCVVPDMRDTPESPDTYFKEGTNPALNNLWASSPWFLQQVNEARAAGEPPPTLPNSQMPLPQQNKETVVLNDDSGVQSNAKCSSADQEPGDFQGLMDILQ